MQFNLFIYFQDGELFLKIHKYMGFSTNFVAMKVEVDGSKISLLLVPQNHIFVRFSAVKYG